MSAYIYVPIIVVVIILKIIFWTWRLSVYRRRRVVVVTRTVTPVAGPAGAVRRGGPNPYHRLSNEEVPPPGQGYVPPPAGMYRGEPAPMLTSSSAAAPPPPSYTQAMNDPTDVKPLSTDPEKALVDI